MGSPTLPFGPSDEDSAHLFFTCPRIAAAVTNFADVLAALPLPARELLHTATLLLLWPSVNTWNCGSTVRAAVSTSGHLKHGVAPSPYNTPLLPLLLPPAVTPLCPATVRGGSNMGAWALEPPNPHGLH
ncbi:hypothetical protein HU200_016399 [Digitaria exilis]|uniref:Uncharacterized protein n=1 Tax=Digitaria exilis TaxID=1010633 RepID=A0A835F904_9POAL|nr:hypothetical protein HU200_016399 [Digitaria exilis]